MLLRNKTCRTKRAQQYKTMDPTKTLIIGGPKQKHANGNNNLQSIIPDNSRSREIHKIATGETKHSVSLMTDKLCGEKLAFLLFFPILD